VKTREIIGLLKKEDQKYILEFGKAKDCDIKIKDNSIEIKTRKKN
jgi:hypothetical protein